MGHDERTFDDGLNSVRDGFLDVEGKGRYALDAIVSAEQFDYHIYKEERYWPGAAILFGVLYGFEALTSFSDGYFSLGLWGGSEDGVRIGFEVGALGCIVILLICGGAIAWGLSEWKARAPVPPEKRVRITLSNGEEVDVRLPEGGEAGPLLDALTGARAG